MATSPKEQNPASEKSEEDVDKTIEDTFPASDPPSWSGAPSSQTPEGWPVSVSVHYPNRNT